MPLPKIFRLTKGGKLIEGIFKGETINTPSMLCVEDYRDALVWADGVGGLKGLIARSEANLAALAAWVERTDWVDFLADVPETRSCTSICLKIVDPWFIGLSADAQAEVPKRIAARLDKEKVAFDINGYRDAAGPAYLGRRYRRNCRSARADGFRLDWAYAQVKATSWPSQLNAFQHRFIRTRPGVPGRALEVCHAQGSDCRFP